MSMRLFIQLINIEVTKLHDEKYNLEKLLGEAIWGAQVPANQFFNKSKLTLRVTVCDTRFDKRLTVSVWKGDDNRASHFVLTGNEWYLARDWEGELTAGEEASVKKLLDTLVQENLPLNTSSVKEGYRYETKTETVLVVQLFSNKWYYKRETKGAKKLAMPWVYCSNPVLRQVHIQDGIQNEIYSGIEEGFVPCFIITTAEGLPEE